MTKLRDFQETGVDYLVKHKKVIVADEPGLGKTLESMCAVDRMNAYPCLVIAPSKLCDNWTIELDKHFPRLTHLVLRTLKEVVPVQVMMVSQDSLYKFRSYIDRYFKPKSIIIDEAHNIKEIRTRRTRAAVNIMKKLDVCFPLTGTPIINSPKELITFLAAMKLMSRFGGFVPFAVTYCEGGATQNVQPRQLKRLHDDISKFCYLRRTKEEVLGNFPKKTREIKPILLPINHQLYKELDSIRELRKQGKLNALTAVSKAREAIGIAKIPYVIEEIKERLKTPGKLLVFAYHKAVQKVLSDAFEGRTVRFPSTTLGATLKQFHESASTRIAVCSLAAGAEGLTLTEADTVIFAEFGWTPKDHIQAEERSYRYGQDKDVRAIYLYIKNSLDEYMVKLINAKDKMASAAVDRKDVKNFLKTKI